jgi:peptidoglycan hydrolase-like protein with peptidoglycan-binding domain
MLTPSVDRALREECSRSLERSQVRRASAWRRRRRRFRARTLAIAAAAIMTTAGGAALAATGGTSAQSAQAGVSGVSASAVQRALGIHVTDVYDSRTKRAVRAFQRRNGLEVDGIVGPKTAAALGLRSRSRTGTDTSTSTDGSVSAKLEQIAQCESGGNPQAVSPDGQYRGKYQFDQQTWESLGGTGDPASAPESEQDRLAAQLYEQRGASSWPNCA